MKGCEYSRQEKEIIAIEVEDIIEEAVGKETIEADEEEADIMVEVVAVTPREEVALEVTPR
jgi:hypothetical protein